MAVLTPKQEKFVAEYLIDLNATQAAIRAGYSKKTARDIGCENLAKPNIAAAIAERQTKILNKLGITAESLLSDMDAVKRGAMSDKEYPPAIKAIEMLGRSLGKDNPFSETVAIEATVTTDTPDLLSTAQRVAFLLGQGVQLAEGKSPKPLH